MSKKKGNLKLMENPEPTWTCGDCSRTFTRLYSLRLHMRRIHGAPYTLLNPKTKVRYPSHGE